MLALNALSYARVERVGHTTKLIGDGALIQDGYELTYTDMDGVVRLDRFVDKRGLCLLGAMDNSHFNETHQDVIEALATHTFARSIKVGNRGPFVDAFFTEV